MSIFERVQQEEQQRIEKQQREAAQQDESAKSELQALKREADSQMQEVHDFLIREAVGAQQAGYWAAPRKFETASPLSLSVEFWMRRLNPRPSQELGVRLFVRGDRRARVSVCTRQAGGGPIVEYIPPVADDLGHVSDGDLCSRYEAFLERVIREVLPKMK